MIHVHNVRDVWGDGPRIWITEKVRDNPMDGTAPYTERVVWTVDQPNVHSVRVNTEEFARMFNGASNRHNDPRPEDIPGNHLEALKDELLFDYADSEHEKLIQFVGFDLQVTSGGSND